jgi:hypothetical protein
MKKTKEAKKEHTVGNIKYSERMFKKLAQVKVSQVRTMHAHGFKLVSLIGRGKIKRAVWEEPDNRIRYEIRADSGVGLTYLISNIFNKGYNLGLEDSRRRAERSILRVFGL